MWGFNSKGSRWLQKGISQKATARHKAQLQSYYFLHDDEGRLTSDLLNTNRRHRNASMFAMYATFGGRLMAALEGKRQPLTFTYNQSHPCVRQVGLDTRIRFQATPEGKIQPIHQGKQPEGTTRKQPESRVSQLTSSNTSLQ